MNQVNDDFILDYNERLFNTPLHGSRFVNLVAGIYYPCFTFDIAGRLIFTPDAQELPDYYEFTDASTEVKFKRQNSMSMPWHADYSIFSALLKEFISSAPEMIQSSLLLIYPDFKPSTVNAMFAPMPNKSISKDEINKIIKILDKKSTKEDLRIEVTQRLYQCGVIQIPLMSQYTPIFHDPGNEDIGIGERVLTVCNGWMTRDEILKKSLVSKQLSV